MPRRIWSNPGNPTAGVATQLGISRQQLREAIHKIKRDATLGATDRITIWDDGTVTDESNVPIGNVYEET